MNAQQLSALIATEVAKVVSSLAPAATAQPVTPNGLPGVPVPVRVGRNAKALDALAKAREAKAAKKAAKVAKPVAVVPAANVPRPAAEPDAPRVWRRGEDVVTPKGRTYAVFLCSGVDGEQAEWPSKVPLDLMTAIESGTVSGQ